MHMSRSALALLAVFSAAPATASPLFFGFDAPGVLPSSQGATFVGNQAEATLYSVSGGLLQLNSSAQGGNAQGQYSVTGIDLSQTPVLEWRGRLTAGGGEANEVDVQYGGWRYNFFVKPNALSLAQTNNIQQTLAAIPHSDGAFRTYRVLFGSAPGAFEVSVDSIPVYSGLGLFNGASGSFLAWGDGSLNPTGGSFNANYDWDYISLASVDEPQTLALFGFGLMTLGLALRQRWRSPSLA
jgi:hypothetical protein